MSQQLADYVSAHGEVIVRVLDLLAVERRLDQDSASIATLLEAETALDAAATALTEAVSALPADSGRRPVGWGEPPAVSGEILIARHQVARIALRCLSADYAGESADADATAEYAAEQLALAARNLAADAAAQAETAKVAPLPSLRSRLRVPGPSVPRGWRQDQPGSMRL